MKKKVVSFWRSLVTAEGEISIKRFASLIGFFLICITFCINIFVDIRLKDFIWDGMLWIVLGGMSLTVAEKFNYRGGRRSQRINDISPLGGMSDDSEECEPTPTGSDVVVQVKPSHVRKVKKKGRNTPDENLDQSVNNNESEEINDI